MRNEPTIFNGEGPMMSGTWYNPANGDSFTVADCFFQDNQYIVKTTDGRMLDYNYIQHYVKTTGPIPKPEPKADLPSEVKDLLAEEGPSEGMLASDIALLEGGVRSYAGINTAATTVDPNRAIIERALGKTSHPEASVDVFWKVFPKKEMGLLIDVMDVNIDDIIDYYTSKVSIEDIRSAYTKALAEAIKLYGFHPSETPEEPSKKPKKTTKK